MNRLHIRTLLMISVGIVVVAIYALSFGVTYYRLKKNAEYNFNTGLYNYAVDLSEHVEIHGGESLAIPIGVYLAKERVFPFQHGESLVEIYSRDGAVLFRYSLNPNAPPSSSQYIDEMVKADQEFYYDTKISGLKWRSLLLPLDENIPPNLFLKVSVPLDFLKEQKEELVQDLVFTITLGGFALLIALVIIARLLSNPLENLSTQTESIRPGNRWNLLQVPQGPIEIKTLAESFNRLLMLVDELVRAEKEFTANAAHQLKTPMTIARGHLELLLNKVEGDSKELVKTSLDEIDQLAQSVSNLLTLSRLESGVEIPNKRKIIADEFLSRLVERLEPVARRYEKKFRYLAEESEQAQFSFEADPFLIAEAFRNMIENAIKYSSSPVVEIKTRVKGDTLLITVTNSVQGVIPVEGLSKNRFFKGSHPNSGHGLGLAISAKILERHGFSMEIQSQNETFTVQSKIKKN